MARSGDRFQQLRLVFRSGGLVAAATVTAPMIFFIGISSSAFERGGEMEPLIGIAQRFTSAEVMEIDSTGHMATLSVEERMTAREARFATYFGESASRWRVKPTVFLPTVPPEFDLGLLEGLVVGMEDGKGTCVGIGLLEYDKEEGILRMVSPITEGVRGLRLGSVKISRDGRSRGTVSLPELFGSE